MAWLVFTTAPDRKTAQRLAKTLVDERIAACVSMAGGARSTYRWKGKTETAREFLLTVKTSKVRQAIRFIEASHPYDAPEAIAVKIDAGSKKYLDWIESSL